MKGNGTSLRLQRKIPGILNLNTGDLLGPGTVAGGDRENMRDLMNIEQV
jgi:hypothetical protein